MKYCLVMGASGDIGSACVRQLADLGWSVYCHYNQNQKIHERITQLRQTYPKQDFFAVQWDLREEDKLSSFISQLFQVDAVIFAEGPTVYKLLPDVTSQEMEELWQVHLKVPMLLCGALQQKLAHQRAGRILFISSIYGLTGSALETVYSGIKGGQIAFCKAYSQEIATLGITVNAIAPGAMHTAMNQHWSQEEIATLIEGIPVNRLGEPDEIAAAASWLLSEQAGYITGSVLPVAGGWHV